jgi:hypothetical protein
MNPAHTAARDALNALVLTLHSDDIDAIDAALEAADAALDAVNPDDETRWAFQRLAELAESIRLELARA